MEDSIEVNYQISVDYAFNNESITTCYKNLAGAIVLASIDDLKKDIKALKTIVDRGFKKDKVEEAVKRVLISESAFFNDNFNLYLETDPKEIVLFCWDTCKADRNKYLKENLHLVNLL